MKPAWTKADAPSGDGETKDPDEPTREPAEPGSDPTEPRAGGRTRLVTAGVAALVVVAVVAVLAIRSGPGNGDLRVSDAVVGANDAAVVAAYLVIDNPGPADRLVSVTSPDADEVTLHATVTDGGLSRMEDVETMAVPADGELRLDPGGSHLMIEGTASPVTDGDTIRLHLEFERAGDRDVVARAVPLAELPERLPR